MASSSNPASASISTADGNNCYNYDVFINHRGIDVKKNFASHLYGSLKAHGLRVFLDMEELQKGRSSWCQIEDAIGAAYIHIAIFSTNYAQSKWCLNELELMVESMQKGSTIIPIFFGVKPSELRWTEAAKGVYAQALRSLQNKRTWDSQPRYHSNIIRKWKKALCDVADISGFELEAYNGNERLLLDEVVQRVREILPKTPLYVSKYPAGLDDKLEDFKATVLLQTQHESGEAIVVGIVGLGGVGKTTLAKEFFNRERTNYPRSCFLSDVREESLKSLQSTLIKDLTLDEDSVEIKNKDEGIEEIRKHLSSSQALIILDDVDHTEQLDALLSPEKNVLDSSSLILVTSRDKGVLRRWGIKNSFIYDLKGLNRQHSTELFCNHGFHQPHPVAGFEQLVEDFLDVCNGLPLSLKVIGALLYGEENLEHWKAQLRKISKIPPSDIQKTLKISYDSLDEEEKQIFLDIAYFFIGEDKDIAIRIWDGSGWEGSLGLQNLQNKCLVETEMETNDEYDGENLEPDERVRIRMHDHVRHMGRYLAEKEHLRRVCSLTDNLFGDSIEREIKSLAKRIHPETERRLHRSPSGSVFSVGQQLICLLWPFCTYSYWPSWIPMKNLRVLEIDGTQLETLWRKAPLQLREFRINCPSLTKIPKSIRRLKHLEQIVLQGYGLKTLPNEFCQLQFLKQLKLISCSYLQLLPDYFGDLTNLQHISLFMCDQLQMLPDSFGNLIQLKFLSLWKCKQLTISKETLGKITTLEFLRVSFCDKIKVLPPQLTDQWFLRELHLNSDFKELPSDIGNLSNLKFLKLFSPCLEMLPPSFGDLSNLEELEFGYFHRFRGISFLGMWTQLKRLSIVNVKNLEQLEINECSSREPTFKNVGGGIETSTDSRGQRVLGKLESVCPNLQHLLIQHCEDLEEVGALPTTLTELELTDCPSLRKIGGLYILAKLHTLNITLCDEMEELSSVETLVSLEKLQANECVKLKRIQGLAQLTKLQELDVRVCPELEELAGVEHLRSLKTVLACGCPKLQWDEEVVEWLGQRLNREHY